MRGEIHRGAEPQAQAPPADAEDVRIRHDELDRAGPGRERELAGRGRNVRFHRLGAPQGLQGEHGRTRAGVDVPQVQTVRRLGAVVDVGNGVVALSPAERHAADVKLDAHSRLRLLLTSACGRETRASKPVRIALQDPPSPAVLLEIENGKWKLEFGNGKADRGIRTHNLSFTKAVLYR